VVRDGLSGEPEEMQFLPRTDSVGRVFLLGGCRVGRRLLRVRGRSHAVDAIGSCRNCVKVMSISRGVAGGDEGRRSAHDHRNEFEID